MNKELSNDSVIVVQAQRLDNQKYWIDRIFKENP